MRPQRVELRKDARPDAFYEPEKAEIGRGFREKSKIIFGGRHALRKKALFEGAINIIPVVARVSRTKYEVRSAR
jgi:hypothetical protein